MFLKITYRLLITCFCLGHSFLTHAQTDALNGNTKTNHAWTAWLGMDTGFEPIKNWSIEIGNQVRFDQNITSFKSNFTQVSTSYKFDDFINRLRKKKDLEKIKHSLRFGGGYRYVSKDQYSQNSQRVFADLVFKPHIEPLKKIVQISTRNRYQHDFTWNRQKSRTLLRSKVSFKFPTEVKVFTPHNDKKKKLDLLYIFAVEYFHQLHYTGHQPYRLRFQGGLDFELPNILMESDNKRYLTLKYVFQHSLNNDDPEADHIIALLYSFSF